MIGDATKPQRLLADCFTRSMRERGDWMTTVTKLEVQVAKTTRSWTVTKAEARFNEVIGRALTEGPQVITRRGRTIALLIAAKECQRETTRQGSLADFFAASPLRGSRL